MVSKRQVSVGEAAHGPPTSKGNEPTHDVLQPAAVAPISYTQHPLSAIFPAMSSEEFAALCADIQGNGLLEEIDGSTKRATAIYARIRNFNKPQ